MDRVGYRIILESILLANRNDMGRMRAKVSRCPGGRIQIVNPARIQAERDVEIEIQEG